MKLIKEYLCDGARPSEEEIVECLEIVDKESCIIELRWFFPYSGWYNLFIDQSMTFDECMDKLPKVYGI